MNLSDILRYGHQTVLKTVDGLPEGAWDGSGVCGTWSAKDVVAHLASFEHVLVDVLKTQLDGGPTPHLDQFRAGGYTFYGHKREHCAQIALFKKRLK